MYKMQTEIKAILFDFDDTLVNTSVVKWRALKFAGQKFYNIEITDDHIKAFWGKPYLEMLTGVFSAIDSVESIKRNYESITSQFPLSVYDNGVIVLEKLLRKFAVGILTSSGRKVVIDDLIKLGFPIHKIIYIQTSEDTDVHKPNPRVFDPMMKILDLKGIKEHEVIYVGDSQKDFQAATNRGIGFIGVKRSGVKEADPGEFTVNSLEELVNQIESINKA